jgi:lysozyme family protein
MKKSDFDLAIIDTLKHEGGYVDHPNDPGGATNYGITHITLAAWRKKPVTKADVKNMSIAEAKQIYKHEFWFKHSLDQLSSHMVAAEVFDTAVNTGKQAIRFVQDLCNESLNVKPKLVRDGIMGSQTVWVLNQLIEIKGEVWVHDALNAKQEAFYRELVKNKPQMAVFLKGWLNKRVKYIQTRNQALAA